MPAKRVKAEDFLNNSPLFKQLGSDEIRRIAAGVTEIEAPRGSTLFQRGDPCLGFHIVVYGQVKLALPTPHGSEKVVELMGPGQSFGEAVMFLDKPYMVTAETLVDSKLLHVAKETVSAEIDRDPRFARRMIAGLSRRLHELMTDLEMVRLQTGAQRVAGYLLRHLPEEDDGAAAPRVILPAKKSIIASRLHFTPEHFSRTLHELCEAGLIEVEGRSVLVLDIGRLRACAGN
ncbi:MAG: Crp/Fnr family transcriptional regulator [Burkholderiales bacterium]